VNDKRIAHSLLLEEKLRELTVNVKIIVKIIGIEIFE